jgi:hypothetical protein
MVWGIKNSKDFREKVCPHKIMDSGYGANFGKHYGKRLRRKDYHRRIIVLFYIHIWRQKFKIGS